jgi:mRNA interferase RelE/StbE
VARYRFLLRPSVTRDVKGIPKQDLKWMLERIEALRDDPRPSGSVKLSGMEYYRVRQGGDRIVYEIQDDILVIIVVKIGHRRNTYRKKSATAQRLFRHASCLRRLRASHSRG